MFIALKRRIQFRFFLLMLSALHITAAVDQCTDHFSNYTPLTPGNYYEDLYGPNFDAYNIYTRIRKVCFFVDSTVRTGAFKRVNGVQMYTIQTDQQTSSTLNLIPQEQCIGACIDTQECHDINGEIYKMQIWYSNSEAPPKQAINYVEYTTTQGNKYGAGPAGKIGTIDTQLWYADFPQPLTATWWQGPFLGHFGTGSTGSLNSLGAYYGEFEVALTYNNPVFPFDPLDPPTPKAGNTNCNCCGSSSFTSITIAKFTYYIRDTNDPTFNDQNYAATNGQIGRTYTRPQDNCNVYIGITACQNQVVALDNSVTDCGARGVTLDEATASATWTNVEVTIETSDPADHGNYTCTQHIQNAAGTVDFYDDFEVEIICDIYYIANDESATNGGVAISYSTTCVATGTPGQCLPWVDDRKYIYIMDRTADAPSPLDDLWISYDYLQVPPCAFDESYTSVLDSVYHSILTDWTLPSWIIHQFEEDDTTQQFQIWTDPDVARSDEEGWWYVTLTGQVAAHLDDDPDQTTATTLVRIAIVDCEAVSFLDQNLDDMIYYVHVEDELQTFLEHEDDRSVMFGDSSSPTQYDLCGRRSYSLVTYDLSPRYDITQKMYITPTDAASSHGDDREIGIYTNDDTLVTIETGVYNIGLKVCLTDYPLICDEFPFTMEIRTSLLSYEPTEMWNFDGTPANGFTRYYPMGMGPDVIAEIPYDLQQQTVCKNTFANPCGEYNQLVTGSVVGYATLPSWITYAQGTGFTVTCNDIYQAGHYQLRQFNEVVRDYWLTNNTMSGLLYLDPCPITSFYSKNIENMSRIVTQSGTSYQTLGYFTDVVGEEQTGALSAIQCGERDYEFVEINPKAANVGVEDIDPQTGAPYVVKPFLIWNPKTFSFEFTSNNLQRKVYYYRLTTWLVDYPGVTMTNYFMVEGLKDFDTPSSFPTRVVGDKAANDIEYTIGEPAVYVDFDIFKNDFKKDTEFYYEIRFANGSQIPSFMYFNQTNMTLRIYAVQEYQRNLENQTYDLVLVVKRYGFEFERLFPFEVKVYTQDNEDVENSAPVLPGINYNFISQYKFGCDNQLWFYTLPDPYDAEDDKVTIEVDLGRAAEFLNYEASSRTFVVAQDVITHKMTGSYAVTVEVHDYSLTTRYEFDFDVYCTTVPLPPVIPPPLILPIDLLPHAVQSLEPDFFVKPILLPVSFTGQATIWFPEDIELITDFDRLTRDVSVVLNDTKLVKPVMEIRALRGEYSEESNLNLNWTLLNVTQRYFLVQLSWEDEDIVSALPDADGISVTFWDVSPCTKAKNLQLVLCDDNDLLLNCRVVDQTQLDWEKEQKDLETKKADANAIEQLINIINQANGDGTNLTEKSIDRDNNSTEQLPPPPGKRRLQELDTLLPAETLPFTWKNLNESGLNGTNPDALISGFSLQRNVPKQISPERATLIWYASVVFSAVLSVLVVYYVIVAFLADESPVRLILSMSHFSMLLHLLSVTVPLPVHVLMFVQLTISHVYKWQYLADIIHRAKGVFTIDEEIANESLPYMRFEEIGYKSQFLHRNTGCILYIYCALAGFALLSLLLKCKDRLRWASKLLIIKGIQLDMLVRRFVFPLVLFCSVQIVSFAAISNISYGPEYSGEKKDFAIRSQFYLSVFLLVLLLIYPLYLFFSYWFGLQAWNLIEDDRERQKRLAFSEYIVADPNTKKNNFNRRTRQILKAIEGQGGEEEQDIEAEQNGVVQIVDEAQLNVAKMEKLKQYSIQRGVLVRAFHVTRLTAGLLYLAVLVLVQVILSFAYVRLAYYTSFQFMVMVMSLILLLIVLGSLNPFALNWDRRLELANISIHTVMICVLTGCSVWGDATIDSSTSRKFVNGWIFGLFLLFILLNFGTIIFQAVVNTRNYHIRSRLDRYHARIEREQNALRKLQNKVSQDQQLKRAVNEVEEDREFGNGPSSDEGSFAADFEDMPPYDYEKFKDKDRLIGFEEFLGVENRSELGKDKANKSADALTTAGRNEPLPFLQYIRPIPNTIAPYADDSENHRHNTSSKALIVSEDRSFDLFKQDPEFAEEPSFRQNEDQWGDDKPYKEPSQKELQMIESASRNKSRLESQSRESTHRDKHESIVEILKGLRQKERLGSADAAGPNDLPKRNLGPGHKTMTDNSQNLKTDLPAGNKAMTAENFYENKPKDDGWGPIESKNTEREKSQASVSRPSKRHELPKAQKWAPFERPRATTGNIHQSNLPGKSIASSAKKDEVENQEEKEFNDFLRGNQDGFF